MERDTHYPERARCCGEKDDLKVNPGREDRRQTHPLDQQNYLCLSVIVEILMNTGMSSLSQLAIGLPLNFVHDEENTVCFFMFRAYRPYSNIDIYQMHRNLLVFATLLVTIVLFAIWRQVFYSKSRVRFLSREQGRELFDRRAVSKLVASYKRKECVVRSAGVVSSDTHFVQEMIEAYEKGVSEFTLEEEKVVRDLIASDRGLREKRWTFLKMDHNIDWGFPFTLEDVIVLPDTFVSSIGDRSVRTLKHESIHIHQRQHQDQYDTYYIKRLGYKKPSRLYIPSSLAENMVTNPDGPDSKWVRKIGDNWYWSALKLRENEKPIGMAYLCVAHGADDFTVTENGVLLSTISQAFDGETNTYHPNEFVASLWSREG